MKPALALSFALSAALAPAPTLAAAAFAPPAPLAAPVAAPVTPRAAEAAPRLFDTCTREGMRKGRYSQYSWCEWFSYFHQNK